MHICPQEIMAAFGILSSIGFLRAWLQVRSQVMHHRTHHAECPEWRADLSLPQQLTENLSLAWQWLRELLPVCLQVGKARAKCLVTGTDGWLLPDPDTDRAQAIAQALASPELSQEQRRALEPLQRAAAAAATGQAYAEMVATYPNSEGWSAPFVSVTDIGVQQVKALIAKANAEEQRP